MRIRFVGIFLFFGSIASGSEVDRILSVHLPSAVLQVKSYDFEVIENAFIAKMKIINSEGQENISTEFKGKLQKARIRLLDSYNALEMTFNNDRYRKTRIEKIDDSGPLQRSYVKVSLDQVKTASTFLKKPKNELDLVLLTLTRSGLVDFLVEALLAPSPQDPFNASALDIVLERYGKLHSIGMNKHDKRQLFFKAAITKILCIEDLDLVLKALKYLLQYAIETTDAKLIGSVDIALLTESAEEEIKSEQGGNPFIKLEHQKRSEAFAKISQNITDSRSRFWESAQKGVLKGKYRIQRLILNCQLLVSH